MKNKLFLSFKKAPWIYEKASMDGQKWRFCYIVIALWLKIGRRFPFF